MVKYLALFLALLAVAACNATSTTAGDATAVRPEVRQAFPTISSAQPTRLPDRPTASPIAANASPTPVPSSVPDPSLAASATPAATATPIPARPLAYSYPVGIPGRPPGDGFFIRDAYAVENTWYNPGWLHTAEDWYLIEGSSVGAQVYAVADGEVVYAGANYPGRVVIVKHPDGLFSMYEHLDPALAVETG